MLELSRHAAAVGRQHQVKGDAAPNLGRKVVQAGAPRQSLVAIHDILGTGGTKGKALGSCTTDTTNKSFSA